MKLLKRWALSSIALLAVSAHAAETNPLSRPSGLDPYAKLYDFLEKTKQQGRSTKRIKREESFGIFKTVS